jgi:hypothetical protein
MVPHRGVTLIPMINLRKSPQVVKLSALRGRASDLLSGEAIDLTRILMNPATPRLLRVEESQ